MKMMSSVLFVMVFLTACPHRPDYVSITRGSAAREIPGLTIQPIDFFYHSDKDSASCSVIFKFSNTTDRKIELDLSRSVLSSSSDTFYAKDVTGMGLQPLTTPFVLLPKSDSLIGFGFQEAMTKFADTVQVTLISGTGLEESFRFRKGRKSDQRRPY